LCNEELIEENIHSVVKSYQTPKQHSAMKL